MTVLGILVPARRIAHQRSCVGVCGVGVCVCVWVVPCWSCLSERIVPVNFDPAALPSSNNSIAITITIIIQPNTHTYAHMPCRSATHTHTPTYLAGVLVVCTAGPGIMPRPLHEHSPLPGGDCPTLVVVATALPVSQFQLFPRSQRHPVTKATNETLSLYNCSPSRYRRVSPRPRRPPPHHPLPQLTPTLSLYDHP